MRSGKDVKREPIQIDENFTVEELVFNLKENSYMYLIVSSLDHEFVINLYNEVITKKVFDFPEGLTLRFRNVTLLKGEKV